MKRIYLSPSSRPDNAYAVGNANEQEQCRKVAVHLKEDLERCGFEVKAGLSGTMYDRVAESNVWNADAHIPIHSNASNGKVAGFRGFGYDTTGEGYRLAGAIMETLTPVMPRTSDGLSAQPQLYEIKASNAPCAYLEIGFHNNPEEAQFIIDHTEEIAEAICKGICAHYGVAYVSVDEPTPSFDDVAPEKWYAQSIAYCVEHGIMQGDGNGKFRPEEPITRAEVAAVMERLHKMLA